MDYNDNFDDDVDPPIPSYRDILIPPNNDDDLDKAIKASLLDQTVNNELDIVMKQSLMEYENNNNIDDIIKESLKDYEESELINDELNIVMQSSLESYNNDVETKLLNDTYIDFLENQNKTKKENCDKLSSFISQLKRLVSLQKNDILLKLLLFIENYSNGTVNELTVNKDEYKKIFNEIKNIRQTQESIYVLKSIINISSDINI